MQKYSTTLIIFIFMILSLAGCQDASEGTSSAKVEKAAAPAKQAEADSSEDEERGGCEPQFRALFDHAVVELRGKGDLDVVIVTDPFCWHCRLGHKLLSEYPEKYGRLRLSFFPRRGYIGSDMAAWILEEMAGTDKLRAYVDFAYDGLQPPESKDLMEARMLVLIQFVEKFPELKEGTTIEELYVRLQKDHEPHVAESAALARAAELPGTPVMVAGKMVLMGFGPGPWLEAMDAKKICE